MKIRIKKMVDEWDLPEDKKNEKVRILNSWSKNLNEREMKLLLEICEKFNYYSEGLASKAYKKIYTDFKKKIPLEETLFFPLRHKTRMESSIDMLSNFRLVNNIDANKIYVDGVLEYLNNYSKNIISLRKNMESFEQEIKELDQKIINLNKKSEIICNHYKMSKINNEIAKTEQQKISKQKQFDKNMKEFNEKYYSIKNLVIIDDFIGTGSSTNKILGKISEIIKANNLELRLFFWVIEASECGEKSVKEESLKLNLSLEINYFKKSIDVLKVGNIFGKDRIREVKETIESINYKNKLKKSIYCKNLAIASFVNAPNNNLTLLSEQNKTWRALFPRIKRSEVRRETTRDELKDVMHFLKKK